MYFGMFNENVQKIVVRIKEKKIIAYRDIPRLTDKTSTGKW